MSTELRNVFVCAATLTIVACGGGAGSGGQPATIPSPDALTAADVQQVIAQAVGEAQAQSAHATVAVVDRVGNVLGVFAMVDAAPTVTITSGTGAKGGLEGQMVPSAAAAIAKAVTGAYLSSGGNAFSTRTAGQIIQDHFNPQESDQPGGPLFGVQFSQLICSDVNRGAVAGTIGPKPSPLGLSADPGGLPLYKNGTLVGGIGVVSGLQYSLDLSVADTNPNGAELIAVAGTYGFSAPAGIRADQIAIDGRTLRFVNSEAIASNPASAPSFAAIDGTQGTLTNVAGYGGSPIVAGVPFGTPPSGYAPDSEPAFAGQNAYTLVDASGAPRFPPMGGTDNLLTQGEVVAVLSNGLSVANHARAQIRLPLGSTAQVSVVVVDTNGAILGLARTPDAPVFGTDVAVQKARTAAFFSSTLAGAELAGLPDAGDPPPGAIGFYVTAMQAFLNDPTSLSNGIAYSNRALGNLARPFFPDGIEGAANGPLSKPTPTQWSVFNDGLQLDLVFNALVSALGPNPPPPSSGCTGSARLNNGIQIFAGSVPIYRGARLVGAVGVSGDGIDQDDMVAFLGLANAGTALGGSIANAPANIRADTIVPKGEGTRLQYVTCPPAPFVDSTQQNVCSGI
jgi:uncharacterized protein GlcG (DUF336 family)